jgi:hypothetical protein
VLHPLGSLGFILWPCGEFFSLITHFFATGVKHQRSGKQRKRVFLLMLLTRQLNHYMATYF